MRQRGEWRERLCSRDVDAQAQVSGRIGVPIPTVVDPLRVLAFHCPAARRSLPWVLLPVPPFPPTIKLTTTP